MDRAPRQRALPRWTRKEPVEYAVLVGGFGQRDRDMLEDSNTGLLVTAAMVIVVTVYMWWRGALSLGAMLATVAFAAVLAGVMDMYL